MGGGPAASSAASWSGGSDAHGRYSDEGDDDFTNRPLDKIFLSPIGPPQFFFILAAFQEFYLGTKTFYKKLRKIQ